MKYLRFSPLLLLLGSCGDGGSDGGGAPVTVPSTPAPSPAPTPTPTPTPTETPDPFYPGRPFDPYESTGAVYDTFEQLTGDRDFKTGCLELKAPVAGGLPEIGGSDSFLSSGSIRYVAGSKTYLIKTPSVANASLATNGRYAFGPANIIENTAANTAYRIGNASGDARLDITRPLGTLQYTRAARLDFTQKVAGSAATQGAQLYCVFGVPVRVGDRGQERYYTYGDYQVNGRIYDRRSGITQVFEIASATVETAVNIDLAAASIASKLFIAGRSTKGDTITLPPFAYSAYFEVVDGSPTGGFSGEQHHLEREVKGDFRGGLFGPNSLEYGYVFRYQDRAIDPNVIAIGVVTGRRR